MKKRSVVIEKLPSKKEMLKLFKSRDMAKAEKKTLKPRWFKDRNGTHIIFADTIHTFHDYTTAALFFRMVTNCSRGSRV